LTLPAGLQPLRLSPADGVERGALPYA
jgi:hypothetical protein